MENNNSNHIKQIPFKFDSRYVFSDTQTRILRIISDEKSIEKLVMSTQLPYVFTTDPIPLIFNFSLSEALLQDPYSQISWIISNKNCYSPFLLNFNLTENTIEKTVLVIFELEIIKREFIPEKYIKKINTSFPKICVEMISNMIKELEGDNKYIYHYESKLLKYSRDKIWEIITNFHIFLSKQGMIQNCSLNTPITQKGCEFSFNTLHKHKNKFCKLKVNKFKKGEDNDKWKLGYLPLEGPFEHSEHYWTLIKVSENETMVININNYSEHINSEIAKEITEAKIRTFETIENILKDVYGNNNVNNNINNNNINCNENNKD